MRPIHVAGLLILSTIWGASFMLIKIMVEEMSPLAVAWFRLGGGGVFITGVAFARHARLPRGRTVWRDIAIVGMVASAFPLVMIPWGQQFIPSNIGAVLNGAMPLWVAGLSVMFLPAERMTRARVGGLFLGFAGLAIVIGPDALDLRAGAAQGQIAIVLATLGYAAGAIYTRKRLLGVNSTALAASQNALAFLYVTPLLLLVEGGPPPLGEISGRVILATIALAFLSQGVAITIYFWLLSNVEAAQASVVTYLAPVTALFWGWLVLAETPPLALIPGLGLIVAGIILVNRRPRAALETTPGAAPLPASATVPPEGASLPIEQTEGGPGGR